MTGKTSTATYALIEAPDPGDPALEWTATIYRKGFKRTRVLRGYSERHLREQCLALGITEFAAPVGSGR